MTQHTELIERLRSSFRWWHDRGMRNSADLDAIAALEASSLEIEWLKDRLAITAKNAFEAMPHDIPQRMKDAICEETGWSGSMVSRMYTELRKAFTGEPYKANEDLDAALLEVARLRKDAERYRFLRDTCWLDTPLEHVICLQLNAKWDRAIDEAIDTAKETKP